MRSNVLSEPNQCESPRTPIRANRWALQRGIAPCFGPLQEESQQEVDSQRQSRTTIEPSPPTEQVVTKKKITSASPFIREPAPEPGLDQPGSARNQLMSAANIPIPCSPDDSASPEEKPKVKKTHSLDDLQQKLLFQNLTIQPNTAPLKFDPHTNEKSPPQHKRQQQALHASGSNTRATSVPIRASLGLGLNDDDTAEVLKFLSDCRPNPKDETDEQATIDPFDLVECKHCHRKFAKHSHAKHEAICTEVFCQKRHPFDPAQKRLKDLHLWSSPSPHKPKTPSKLRQPRLNTSASSATIDHRQVLSSDRDSQSHERIPQSVPRLSSTAAAKVAEQRQKLARRTNYNRLNVDEYCTPGRRRAQAIPTNRPSGIQTAGGIPSRGQQSLRNWDEYARQINVATAPSMSTPARSSHLPPSRYLFIRVSIIFDFKTNLYPTFRLKQPTPRSVRGRPGQPIRSRGEAALGTRTPLRPFADPNNIAYNSI